MTLYLHIPNVKGSVTENNYRHWIPLHCFSFSTEREIDFSLGNLNNRTASQPQTDEFFISREIDQTSPFFFSEAFSGKAISEIKLRVLSSQGPFVEYTLSNVIVSGYGAFIIAEDIPIEGVSFNFTHLEIRYFSYEEKNVKPISAKAETGSRPSYASQLKRGVQNRTEEGFKLFVATVYGEACGASEVAWQAVGSTIINRVDSGFFKISLEHHKRRLFTAEEVIKNTGYDAYRKNTREFRIAIQYLNHQTGVAPKNITRMRELLYPIYYKNETITVANHYYSPKAQRALHQTHPNEYPETPKWVVKGLREHSMIEISVVGLRGTDDFLFFKRIR